VWRFAARDDLTTSRVAAELKRALKFSENFIEIEHRHRSATKQTDGLRANIAKLPMLVFVTAI
jgi:hypothetical protein